MMQRLITMEQRKRLLANGRAFAAGEIEEMEPVVNVYNRQTDEVHLRLSTGCQLVSQEGAD